MKQLDICGCLHITKTFRVNVNTVISVDMIVGATVYIDETGVMKADTDLQDWDKLQIGDKIFSGYKEMKPAQENIVALGIDLKSYLEDVWKKWDAEVVVNPALICKELGWMKA